MEVTHCFHCGTSNAPAQRFCGACGEPLQLRCSACGSPNPPTHRFCGACGAPVKAVTTPASERLPEERRWTTVLFADLSGFTSVSERMDPEDVRALVDRCMAMMGEVVVRYGGFVERVIGDELLALFGAPVAHEDDPERAVRAALELQRCAVEHAAEFGGLPLRIGLNTGEVMFAPVGPEGARHLTVMGDVANTASRLQTAAPPGGILVGEETYRATVRAVRYQPVEPFRAKGKEAPVAAWRPLDAPAPPSVRPLSAAPMVGRDAEFDVLWRAWEQVVAERRPRLVTVIGAPGIGKTRLARELVTRAEARGARCLPGRSLPYGERTGYGAFAEQVKGFAGIFDSDPVPEARTKLAEACQVLPDDEAGEVASHLAVLLGLAGDENVVPEKGHLLYSARRFVEAVGQRLPLVLLFEDVHWSDPSLLELIESLAGRVRHTSVLLLTLARPELLEIRPTWAGGLPAYTALPLDPLSADGAEALASRIVPHLGRDVAARLADVAGGNPLFIEELAASVSDARAELLADLPTNVKATIAARLDALPPSERQVVLDASVVGKVFWRGALERLGEGRNLPELLDSLERRDFIRREPASRFRGDTEYSFKHMLIREVAHGTLPKSARRERHRGVARFLEEAAGDRLVESASLLAYHWLEAGDEAKALDYLVQAADHARRAWASGEAIRLYDQALGLVPPSDEGRGRQLRLDRAFARFEAGDLEQAAADLDGMLLELADGVDRAEALFLRAQAAFYLADERVAARFSRELAKLADRLGHETYQRLSLFAQCLDTMLGGSLHESVAIGERALRSWPAGERSAERSLLMGSIGLEYYWTGDYHRSAELNDAAWRLGLEVRSLTAFLHSGPHVGLALAGLGRAEDAIVHCEWVLAKARELELVPRWTSRCLGMFAGVLYEIHETDRARGLSEEAIETSGRAAFPPSRVFAKIDLLRADMAAGQPGRDQAAWSVLWEEAGDLKGWHEWLARGRLLRAKAEILLAAGRADEAAEAATTGLAHWRRYTRPKYEAAALASLGQAHQAAGRPAEGSRELRRALEIAERLGHPPTIWDVAGKLVPALVAVGDDEGAEVAANKVAATIDGFASALSEARRAAFLAAPRVREALAAGR